MSHIVRWNVRNRFVVAFIVVAVVPLVVFGALVYSRTAKALREVEQRPDRRRRRPAPARSCASAWRGARATSATTPSGTSSTRPSAKHRALWIDDNVTDWVPANSDDQLVTRVRRRRPRRRARRRPRLHAPVGERARAGGAPRRDRRRPRRAWTAGSTSWPPRRSSPRRTRHGRRACSSSARPSPTASSRASTGSPAARDGSPSTPAARSPRPPTRRRPVPPRPSRPADVRGRAGVHRG